MIIKIYKTFWLGLFIVLGGSPSNTLKLVLSKCFNNLINIHGKFITYNFKIFTTLFLKSKKFIKKNWTGKKEKEKKKGRTPKQFFLTKKYWKKRSWQW